MSEKPQVILDLQDKIKVSIEAYSLNTNGEIIYLDLSYKKFDNLFFLSELVNLEVLELRNIHTNSEELENISKLHNLTHLDLRNNQLTSITFISTLINLFELDLSSNSINDIKPLKTLIKLSYLKLEYNLIYDIRSLKYLKKLEKVLLDNNYVSDYSPILGLKNLKIIFLRNNQIKRFIPLTKIISLEKLDLSENLIDYIDTDLLNNFFTYCNIYDIDYAENTPNGFLNFYKNPLYSEIIDAINSGGKKALYKYLESKERETIRIPEAKMVLLGEPRAGKTTLQKYLMGVPINENEESTSDIQISTWKPFENDSKDKNKDIKINLWDFGGQEIQYSLHKLFMTEDTLYIIVLDSTKDQTPLKYLKFLENYAPKSPFIIINNYGDAPTSNMLKIDENYLRENYDGKEGMPVLRAIFNRVSITKAARLDPSFRKIMDEVEATIKSELLSLKNLNKEFPKEYQLVKSAIEQEYSKPDKHYITMSYYRELCKTLKITDDEELRIAILGYLNEIGVLRYFKDSPVTDKHILNPKWLIDGAYSLIIDDETANNFGVLTKNQARNILKRSKKGFKFEEDESEFIFKTMKFYGLLHSDENEQKVYIPLRFKSLQPTTLLDFYENGKHFAFEFKSDIPEEIISNLIVKHFEEIAQHYYWSKGAVFENNKVRILVKVEDRNIHFYVQGQFHQSYFEILRRTLRKSLERLPGLGYEEIVEFDLNGKKIRVVYEHLIDVFTDKLEYYYDHPTKTKIFENQIIKILGGYFSSTQIQQITNVTNNNFYGTFNDNRFQQITIIQELNSLVQLAQNFDDKKKLEEIRSEIQLLNQTNDVEKKESIGKKLLGKIKKLSTDSFDDVVKDKLKELFPKIVKEGIDWIEKVDLDGIIQIFGGIL